MALLNKSDTMESLPPSLLQESSQDSTQAVRLPTEHVDPDSPTALDTLLESPQTFDSPTYVYLHENSEAVDNNDNDVVADDSADSADSVVVVAAAAHNKNST